MSVVDLLAVARARIALRGIAENYPELTAPPARIRLSASLTLLYHHGDTDMTEELTTFTARVPKSLLEALDREAQRLSDLAEGAPVSRNAALISVLRRTLATVPVATVDPSDLFRHVAKAREAGHTVASLAAAAGAARSTLQSWIDKNGKPQLGCAAALAAHLRSLGF